MTKLKIGAPSYINALPFFYPLMHKKIACDATFVFDHPVVINEKLSKGEIDIGLISSANFLDHRKDYTRLTDYGIGAIGEVMSVALFIKKGKKLASLKKIAVPTSSETSTELLFVLMKHFWKITPEVIRFDPATPLEKVIGVDATLLIGDSCLKKRRTVDYDVIDLAKAWHNVTGLGSIFALFACNQNTPQTTAFEHTLEKALSWSFLHMDEIVTEAKKRLHIQKAYIANYYSLLDFILGEIHFQGLELFHTLRTHEAPVS